MTKQQKILLFGAVGVFLVLVALIIVLIVQNSNSHKANQQLAAQNDSLLQATGVMMEANIDEMSNLDELTAEFNRLNAEFDVSVIANDSILQQYQEAMDKLKNVEEQLRKEKQSNNANQKKIAELEAQVETLKGIARHYLEEIRRLGEENEKLQAENAEQRSTIENLRQQNTAVSQSNAQLEKTVQIAKRLQVTQMALKSYKKENGNAEKKLQAKKAKVLGVNFTVAPNSTASAGMKTFYVRITSPEGTLLGSGPSFSYDGQTLGSTVAADKEYNQEQATYEIYWKVNTTLTPGSYKVEVFADGDLLSSRSFTMEK